MENLQHLDMSKEYDVYPNKFLTVPDRPVEGATVFVQPRRLVEVDFFQPDRPVSGTTNNRQETGAEPDAELLSADRLGSSAVEVSVELEPTSDDQ